MPVRLLVTGTSKLLENQKKLTVPIHVINLAEYNIINYYYLILIMLTQNNMFFYCK